MLAATAIWFATLSMRPLFDPDEGRYAEIPREMLGGGNWIIPRLDGIIYLEKPPLQYWLTALGFASFGQDEFSARSVPALAGYVSLFLMFWLGRRLFGAPAGARAVLLAGASILFVLLGHQLTLDMLLSFWLLASLSCFLLSQASREQPQVRDWWMLGCWAAMALAVLTKGLIGILIPGFTAVFYAVWQRDRRLLHEFNFRWGVLVLLAIDAPWFILSAHANPEFLRFFFIREHLQRFFTPIEHRSEPWWYFLVVLALGILPWLAHAVRDLVSVGRDLRPRREFAPERILWVWSVFVVVFFSLSDSKLVPYVLPAIPALALLCARRTPCADRIPLMIGAGFSALTALGITVYTLGAWGSTRSAGVAITMRPGLLVTAGLIAAVAFASIVMICRQRAAAAFLTLCCGWFLAAAGLQFAANEGQRFFSPKDIALWLQANVPATSPLFSVRLYDQSVPFYLKRTVVLVEYRDELAFGLDQQPNLGVATLDEFAARWKRLASAFAVMRPDTRDLLRARGLPFRQVGCVDDEVLISRR